MKRNPSIQLKAAFLLIIFSLNMIVGFVCVMGVEMGFNKTHHHEEEVAEIHANGKTHHHEEAEHSHKDGKDNCCSDKVLKISQAYKVVPQAAKLLSPVFFTVFDAVYYDINVSYPSQVDTSNKYFARSYHPPIPDIRIAIQSFQI